MAILEPLYEGDFVLLIPGARINALNSVEIIVSKGGALNAICSVFLGPRLKSLADFATVSVRRPPTDLKRDDYGGVEPKRDQRPQNHAFSTQEDRTIINDAAEKHSKGFRVERVVAPRRIGVKIRPKSDNGVQIVSGCALNQGVWSDRNRLSDKFTTDPASALKYSAAPAATIMPAMSNGPPCRCSEPAPEQRSQAR